jgi:hypothetical protein
MFAVLLCLIAVAAIVVSGAFAAKQIDDLR